VGARVGGKKENGASSHRGAALAQQMAKTPITRLLRIGWESVGKIVSRVIADHLDHSRLMAW
jgi:hypothetical protein